MTATEERNGRPLGQLGLFRNPHLLTVPLVEGFLFVKNPLLRGAERVINPIQSRVLSCIIDAESPEQLAERCSLSMAHLRAVLSVLSASEFIGNSPHFKHPEILSPNNSLSLWVHTSNRCNLACSYCYVNAEKAGGLQSDVVLDQLISQIELTVERRGVKSVQLKIAGGEPLLTFGRWQHKLAILKERLRSIGVAASLQILTNGTVLTSEIISYIKKHDVGVGLSIDGYGEYHDKTRVFHSGSGSFAVVVRNLAILRENDIDPYVTSVVTPENTDGLCGLTQFFVTENLRFRFSLAKGLSFDICKLSDTLGECYSIVEAALPSYRHFLAHTLCDLSFDRPIVDTPCGVGRSHASINTNGEIHACQTQHRLTPLGMIDEERDLLDTLQDVQVRSELSRISETCETCDYRYVCGGGCPVAKVANKSPFCILFHMLLPTILRLRGLTLLHDLVSKSRHENPPAIT